MRAARLAAADMLEPPPVLLRSVAGPQAIAIDVTAGDFIPLTRLLQQLNHRVIGNRLDGRPSDRATCKVAAALVSDALDRSLDRCRDLAASCPVILISDQTSFAFRLAAARAGVSAMIRRPVAATELSEWLDHLSCRESAQISVLIVDDDALASEINGEVLRSAGMSVTVSSDLARVLDLIEETSPNIVLIDMRMPGVDGVELAQVIRQSMHFVSLPIIFLSAERDEARQLSARRFGGDDFIAKPVSPSKLVSVVRMRAERSRVLRSLIEHDRLTGLLDHTRFKERLAHELERCRRSGNHISLVMVDVDFFKNVNDAYGHAVGDDVLRGLADVLRGEQTQAGIVGRCGGEEFGIIMLDTVPEAAGEAVEALKDRFGSLRFGDVEPGFSVTFSAGVASSRQTCVMPELVALADAALYQSKRQGRNRVTLSL